MASNGDRNDYRGILRTIYLSKIEIDRRISEKKVKYFTIFSFFILSRFQAQKCYVPDVCCRIPDPETTSLTDDGYVVRVPQNPLIVPSVRPFVPSTSAPIYLPPTRIPVISGEGQLSLPINPPPKNTIDDPIANLPVTCAAALNCTEIEYCTASGVISKTPVVLTKDQEIFRVPLTDCQDPVKGIVGKCCRDPDYVDPWPVSQLGQYTDPKLFGDDGQYRPVATQQRPQFAAQLAPQIPPKPAAPAREIYRPAPVTAAPVFSAQLSPAIYPAPATCGARNPVS